MRRFGSLDASHLDVLSVQRAGAVDGGLLGGRIVHVRDVRLERVRPVDVVSEHHSTVAGRPWHFETVRVCLLARRPAQSRNPVRGCGGRTGIPDSSCESTGERE